MLSHALERNALDPVRKARKASSNIARRRLEAYEECGLVSGRLLRCLAPGFPLGHRRSNAAMTSATIRSSSPS